MKNVRSLAALCALAVMLLGPREASAGTLTIEFEGVHPANAALGIPAGTPFQGFYTVDDTSPLVSHPDTTINVQTGVGPEGIVAWEFEFPTLGVKFIGTRGGLAIGNDTFFGDRYIATSAGAPSFAGDPFGVGTTSMGWQFDIQDIDAEGADIISSETHATIPNLANTSGPSRRIMKMTIHTGTGPISTTGEVTSLGPEGPPVDPDLDSDGDGLTDIWETDGYIHDNGFPVDLPGLGANPMRKDVFVEIDYMAGHRPPQEALDAVVAAFAAAPVSNPDGSTGINLHLILSDELPHMPVLGSIVGGGYRWSLPGSPTPHFTNIKFNNFAEERQWAFHYCVWADEVPGPNGWPISGLSRGAPSSDFIIALGPFPPPTDPSHESWWGAAGTLMHELGHNLGLSHGGDDEINYKPNYLSVMNYSFQFSGLIRNGSPGYFDYSRFAFDPLDEANLDESVGLTPAGPAAGFGTVWFWIEPWEFGGATYLLPFQHRANDASGPVNWRWVEPGEVQSVNSDGDTELLFGHDDWANLDFEGGTLGPGVPLPLPDFSPEPDSIDLETVLRLRAPAIQVPQIKGRVTKGTVKLTWKPVKAPEGVAQYRIYRDGEQIGITTRSNFKDASPLPSTTHAYHVTWVNLEGQESVASATVELTTSDPAGTGGGKPKPKKSKKHKGPKKKK